MMPLATLPAAAKITELRLWVSLQEPDDLTRALTREQPYGSPVRELWACELALAPMKEADLHALAATIEGLDGRAGTLKLELIAGKFGAVAGHTASLVAAPALLADTLTLNLSPTSGTLLAGTLLTLGDVDAGAFQMFEVLEDVAASSAAVVPVAPRVRESFLVGASVTIGTVWARFKPASDDVNASVRVAYGEAMLSLIEAV